MTAKAIKTLVSKYVAKVGHRFLFSGPMSECLSCRFRHACLGNLEAGVVYEVVQTYNIVNKCPVLGEVVTVDVKPAEIDVALDPRAAIEGMVTTYRHIDCKTQCNLSELCRSPWIKDGSKVKVVSVEGRIPCKVGKNLTRVKVVVLPQRS